MLIARAANSQKGLIEYWILLHQVADEQIKIYDGINSGLFFIQECYSS